jgi:hypothetical protein
MSTIKFLLQDIYIDLNRIGGADRGRTGDLMNAIHALYQLSYSPLEKNSRKRYEKRYS